MSKFANSVRMSTRILLALNLMYPNENSRIRILKKQLHQPRREQDYAVTVGNMDIPNQKRSCYMPTFTTIGTVLILFVIYM